MNYSSGSCFNDIALALSIVAVLAIAAVLVVVAAIKVQSLRSHFALWCRQAHRYKSVNHLQINTLSNQRRTPNETIFKSWGTKHPRYTNINTMNFTTNRYMYQEGQRGHWHVMKRAGGYMVLQEVCSSQYEARKRVWELNGWKKKQQKIS